MNVCFAVTSGCYSDYSIDRVFSTREAAESYLTRMKFEINDDGYGYRVEEFAFDTEAPAEPRYRDVTEVEVCFKLDDAGGVHRTTDSETTWVEIDSTDPPIKTSGYWYPDDYRTSYPSRAIYITVTGCPAERVRKVASERAARVVAHGFACFDETASSEAKPYRPDA